jgi:hypothetical protein
MSPTITVIKIDTSTAIPTNTIARTERSQMPASPSLASPSPLITGANILLDIKIV